MKLSKKQRWTLQCAKATVKAHEASGKSIKQLSASRQHVVRCAYATVESYNG